MPDSHAETPWHHLETRMVFSLLETDPETGLSSAEAAARLAKHGPNEVTASVRVPGWLRFLQQFNQPLIYILLGATVITAFLGEWVDCSVIFAVVLVNAIVGYIQESKAEKAIDALSRMVVTSATVRRDGHRERVPSRELVPGDIVLLQAGDLVPADLRLFRVKNLQVDEAPLTGESLPVAKHADPLTRDVVLADRRNLAYAGTLVATGFAEGMVWATGNRTETGRIARLIAGATEISTPLTKKIADFSRLLLWAILGLAVITFIVGVLRGTGAVEMFMVAVALAVGAIPEGLPAAVTVLLAIGVSRMAKRRAIIRKLPAVETLGGTTVICSDKTGTLTENRMMVQEAFAGGAFFEFTGTGYETKGEILREGEPVDPLRHPALRECLRAGVLCNDSKLLAENGVTNVHGDPTEGALLVSGAKAGLPHAETRGEAPQLDMIPFESEQMFRATLHQDGERRMIYKVGAVERLLQRCDDMLDAGGGPVPLDEEAIRVAVEAMAAKGLRVLAFARRHGDDTEGGLEHGHVSGGLTFLGLQGMIDPPRTEAIHAVEKCHRAGIRVKMITGDHPVTARAIAARIGLGKGDECRTLTGRELEDVADEDLPDVAERTPVFARVAPEQKLRLVEALQSRGHIVAMTGDGVNDAPALKQANIGIAMGITGTDVAKGAADMILTDDNFAAIESAVEEGRGVFDNLLKFIVWTLPTNLGETCIVMGAVFFGLALPILPVQLLWINLGTTVCLGMMLMFEPKEPGLMKRPPRDPRRPLLTFPLLMRTGLVSLFMVAGGFWIFFRELQLSGGDLSTARTAVVQLIVLVETAYLFNCRSLHQPLTAIGLWSNRPAIAGAVAMVGVQFLYGYAPFMNALFQSTPLGIASWLRIGGVALLCFLVVELEKYLRFGRRPVEEAPE